MSTVATAPVPDERALTVAEIAEHLHVSVWTVYARIHAGDIPAFKVGRIWRGFKSVIDAHMQQQPQDPWARSSHSRAARRVA